MRFERVVRREEEIMRGRLIVRSQHLLQQHLLDHERLPDDLQAEEGELSDCSRADPVIRLVPAGRGAHDGEPP